MVKDIFSRLSKTYFIRYISGLLHAKSCKYGGHLCREGGVAEAVAEEA